MTRARARIMAIAPYDYDRTLFLEIPRIRGCLAFLGRHQKSVPTDEIILRADTHMRIAFGANILGPIRFGIGTSAVGLRDRPGSRQSIVDGRDFVAQKVAIVTVEIQPLLDHTLVVGVQRDAGGIIDARPLEMPRLDFEHVEAAIAIFIEPSADRIA